MAVTLTQKLAAMTLERDALKKELDALKATIKLVERLEKAAVKVEGLRPAVRIK